MSTHHGAPQDDLFWGLLLAMGIYDVHLEHAGTRIADHRLVYTVIRTNDPPSKAA